MGAGTASRDEMGKTLELARLSRRPRVADTQGAHGKSVPW